MEVSLHTEPHLLAGTVNPTVGKRNVTLPIDNGLNLVEWRQRKEQARGQVTVFGRRLRVSYNTVRSNQMQNQWDSFHATQYLAMSGRCKLLHCKNVKEKDTFYRIYSTVPKSAHAFFAVSLQSPLQTILHKQSIETMQ